MTGSPATPLEPTLQGFHATLRARVDAYFNERRLSTRGGAAWLAKAAFFVLSTLALYAVLLAVPLSWPWFSAAAVILGLSFAAIGFNVMHDAVHGSASKAEWVNRLFSFSLEGLGGSARLWRAKHNIAHHSHTNVDGADDDIELKPLMRLSPDQPRRPWHRFQFLYAPLLYALTHSNWILFNDFRTYFRGRIAQTRLPPARLSDHLTFWASKTLFLFLALGLPCILIGWQKSLVGYAIASASAGLTLAIIFQLAHTVKGVAFTRKGGQKPSDWAADQVRSTANFSAGNPLMAFLTGGLNHQVEHHLFAKVSHLHYPAISRIVKQTCLEWRLPYLCSRTFFGALLSHFRHLYAMGRNPA